MSIAIKSYKEKDKATVIRRRLAAGARERGLAKKEKRKPLLGLGYWAALHAACK